MKHLALTPPYSINNQQITFLEKESTYSLRGFCMIMILAHHIWQHVFHEVPYIGVFMFSMGWIATGLFFFLSGYGLYLSLKRNEPITLRYCGMHIMKLIKPFLFGYITFMIYDLSIGSFDVLYYIHCLFTLTMPTTVSWFFKVITVTYILTFFIFRYIKQDNNRIIAICVISGFYFVVSNLVMESYWYMSILNFPLGILFAKHKELLSRPCNNLWLYMIVAFAITFAGTRISSHLWFIPNLAFSILCVYLLPKVNIKDKVLKYIGVNSLCFYLYEMHPLYWLDQININPWLYAVGVYAIATLMTIIYVFIDKHLPSIWNKNIIQANVMSKS